MTVVSNTSPLRYLIAVGRADLVEQIFRHVLIPHAVERELTDPSTPEAVRQWMAERPAWLEIRPSRPPDPELGGRLDRSTWRSQLRRSTTTSTHIEGGHGMWWSAGAGRRTWR